MVYKYKHAHEVYEQPKEARMNKHTKETIIGHIMVTGGFFSIIAMYAALCWIMGV